MAFTPGSPLYHHDVVKLDRQDDNAAACLSLQRLSNFYQRNFLSVVEQLSFYWRCYLEATGYSRSQYFLSAAAADIVRIIVEGIIGLILAYCDHIRGNAMPLLPWYHFTEACEHTFGEAHSIVKDFTHLDFLYMVPKLGVRMQDAVLSATISDPNKTAVGYCHTYFDHSGANISTLAIFPSNDEIKEASLVAAEQAKSLMLFLGVLASKLNSHREQLLLAIDSWFQGNIRLTPIVKRAYDEDQLTMLACTAITLALDDFSAIHSLPEYNSDEEEETLSEDCISICTVINRKLPELQIPADPSKPVGHLQLGNIDVSDLVELHFKHQTEHAARAVTICHNVTENVLVTAETLRCKLIGKFNELL
ncbi:hypothetical protein BDQ17DRAFT_1429173 [Cyathus striatus]|nr:hypothetical protein BDQ17DRAFT_1429173 [Cyathus striatus]